LTAWIKRLLGIDRSVPSGKHELRWEIDVGWRAGFCEGRRIVDQFGHLCVDLAQHRFISRTPCDDLAARNDQRAFLLPRIDLFLLTITLPLKEQGLSFEVALNPVCVRLYEAWPLTLAGPFDSVTGGAPHGRHVIPINFSSRNSSRPGTITEFAGGDLR